MDNISYYIEELKRLQLDDDREQAHGGADEVLCSILVDLGYKEVVDEYAKVPKYYA